MSDDLGDLYRAHKKAKQERHASNYSKNMTALHLARNEGVLTLNIIEFPTIIHVGKYLFYPHTGRWQERGSNRMYRGGAEAFIQWLKGRK